MYLMIMEKKLFVYSVFVPVPKQYLFFLTCFVN